MKKRKPAFKGPKSEMFEDKEGRCFRIRVNGRNTYTVCYGYMSDKATGMGGMHVEECRYIPKEEIKALKAKIKAWGFTEQPIFELTF